MYITIKSFNYKLLDFYLGKIKNKMFNKLKVVYLPLIKKWSVLNLLILTVNQKNNLKC